MLFIQVQLSQLISKVKASLLLFYPNPHIENWHIAQPLIPYGVTKNARLT
jgi:hypothetical protein